MTNYLTPRKACQYLNVSEKTLRNWDRDKLITAIRTPTNQRRYDIDSVLGVKTTRVVAIYARVSSAKQKEDLQRQIDFLQEKYPQGKLYKDIGGGLNFKRRGLLSLLESVLSGNVESIVVGHQDPLLDFVFLEFLSNLYDIELIVIGENETN